MALFKTLGYSVGILGYDWQQGVVYDGMCAGAKTVPIFGFKFESTPSLPDLKYRAHIFGDDWTAWASSNETCGQDNSISGIDAISLQFSSAPTIGTIFVRALIDGAWTDLQDVATAPVLGQPGIGSLIRAIQCFPIVPHPAGFEALRISKDGGGGATPRQRLDYVKDSVACIAALGALGVACAETAGLACISAGGAVFALCTQAIETGADFVENEAGAADASVSDPAVGNDPGDTHQDADGPEE